MGQSIRSLSAEAGLTTAECLRILHGQALRVRVGAQRLEGHELSVVRKALGLDRRASASPTKLLSREEMVVRLLRPLREKGKLGRTHTTAFEHLHTHGFPDHQKDAACELAEDLLSEGCLEEKPSVGQRHVWLTAEGLTCLEEAEKSLS